MFKLQSLFESCPENGGIEYRLELPVGNSDGSIRVEVQTQDSVADCPVVDGKISLDRRDGPGIRRFDMRCISKSDANAVLDQIWVDVVILPESSEHVSMEVDKALQRKNPGNAAETQSASDALFAECRGAELPEILRRLALGQSASQTVFSAVNLVTTLLDRPHSRSLHPTITEVLTEIISTSSDQSITIAAFQAFKKLQMKPAEKWPFMLRMLMETSPTSGFGYNAVADLIETTPKASRPMVLAIAESLCDSDSKRVPAIARLFQMWNHKAGIPKLLPAYEINPAIGNSVLPAIQACNYREAIPFLVGMLDYTTGESTRDLISCLATWKAEGAKSAILEKLETENNPYNAGIIVANLMQYGDPSLRQKVAAIRDESSEAKAKAMDAYLQNWK